MHRWVALAGLVLLLGCGSSGHTFGAPADGGGVDGTTGSPDGGNLVGDDGGGGSLVDGSLDALPECNPQSLDLVGCNCPAGGATRACYTGPATTRNIGLCKDGSQTCIASGEFGTWGPCNGSVTPAPEVCDGTVDRNCNGSTGCSDPTCTSTPLCNTGCTTGQTRSCYTGPSGTENVGACKDGTQTCTNNQWGTCTGETLPQPEDCCAPSDLNCNGLKGCYDLFACITAACCQSSCDAGGGLDPGCVCMTGSGDTATCPQGDYYSHKGGIPGTDECCPCSASTCSNYNCCGESVCAGATGCSGMSCRALPASCNGTVSADCDDFPEDCDEPCCECTDGTC
jgi:hypothetical protein